MNPERALHHENPDVEEISDLHHPELHDPNQEVRLDGVEHLSAQRKIFHRYGTEELAALQKDFRELPEVVEYASEPAQLDFWRERLTALPEEIRAKKITPTSDVAGLIDSVESMLQGSIERYSETVRQFRTAEIKRFHLEPEEFRMYMQNADTARRRAHEVLLDSVKAFSRTISQKVPALLSGSDKAAWEEDVQQRWFDHSRITNRTAIGEWAIRTEMFEKSQQMIEYIDDIMKKKQEVNP